MPIHVIRREKPAAEPDSRRSFESKVRKQMLVGNEQSRELERLVVHS